MKKVIDLTGQRFGRLVVIREDSQRTSRGQIKWICQCDCGNIVSVVGGNLRNGHTQSCGCICKEKGRGKKDLLGQRFGRLTVIQEDPERNKYGKIKWICRCDCGNTVSVLGGNLRGGHTLSCGCLTRERIAKIGKDHKDDLTGKRFGRLTVIKEDPIRDGSCVKWICRCDCGNIVSVGSPSLRSRNTLSCGCLQKEIVRKDVVGGTKVSTITPNRKPNSNNTSGKRGVYWDKAGQKWFALICFRKHSYYLGRTDDFKEACRMRDEAEEHIYGNFLKWYAEAYPEEWRRLSGEKGGKSTMRKVFLESNGYNMLGFIFDDGMVAFDCETIDQALVEDCSGVEGCKTAEEAATNCNTKVIKFKEDEWESVTEITQKWARYEYRDKGGVGNLEIYSTKEEALKAAGEEWRNLVQSDKDSYIKDAAGSFYVGLFNACVNENGDWLIGADPVEVAMDYLEG